MDLVKSIDYFNPIKLKGKEIHVIGVGAVGSYIALTLVKLGIDSLYIWDFDTVESKNCTNQVYDETDIGKEKTTALDEHLKRCNPNINVYKRGKYNGQPLKGIIFLTVDSIKTRREILEHIEYNPFIELVVDGRIGLEKGQVIATDWIFADKVKNHIALSDFDDSEIEVPVSACGTTLSIAPSVIITSQVAVAQLINFVNGKKLNQLTSFDAFEFKMISN